MGEAELIVDLAGAEALADDWDALAVNGGMPMSSPAWMLSWWRHLAPSSAELRVVVVRDRGRMIGVVPLYVDLARRATARSYRLLANDLLMVAGPLSRPDREWEVAEATADLLATPELRPDLLELGPMPVSSPRVNGAARTLACADASAGQPPFGADGDCQHPGPIFRDVAR